MNDTFTVPPEPVATASAGRTAFLARVGLLGIAAAALVAVAMLVVGASLAPARTLAGGDVDSGTNGATGAGEDAGGIIEFRHGPGFGHGMAIGLGGITVTAIDGNDITLETADGWTRTITVDEDTEYTRSGDEITLADLEVGDRIAFRQTREDDGTWTIDRIAVILPHRGGEVTEVDGSTITVAGRGDSTTTIHVTADTEYRVNGDEATLEDIEKGMVLIAEGTEAADGTFTATRVRATDPGRFFRDGPHLRGPGAGEGRPPFGFGPWFDREGAEPDPAGEPSASTSAT